MYIIAGVSVKVKAWASRLAVETVKNNISGSNASVKRSWNSEVRSPTLGTLTSSWVSTSFFFYDYIILKNVIKTSKKLADTYVLHNTICLTFPSYNHNSWGKTKSFDQLEINGWSSDEIWRSCFKFNSCNFKSLLAAPENTFKKSGLNTNHNLAVTEFLYLANVVSWEVVNAMVRLGMRNIELWWNAVVRREDKIFETGEPSENS